jgi:hypothetical protein
MAVTIDATVGSADANSYITLAEAETYMEGRLNVDLWDAATDATKDIALVEAQRWLTPMGWVGERTDGTQALSWPRQWAFDPDSPIQDYFDTDVIPVRVKDAQAELALQFIKAGTTDIAALQPAGDGIIEERVDVIAVRYESSTMRPTGTARYPSVLRYIQPLLTARPNMAPLVKG